MTDISQWPLTATYEVTVSEAQHQLTRLVFSDLPDVSDLKPLVTPPPLIDKALLDRDNDKEEL